MKEYGSEFHIFYGSDSYFEDICQLKGDYAFLRSGREAITLASESINLTKGDTILMPAYCCRSMDDPFLLRGINVEYYELNENLIINEQSIFERIVSYMPKAIFVMNYYGFTRTDSVVNKVKGIYPTISIIEDFSHNLFTLNSIYNNNIDYYVASIRKSIGVPDGGVILSNSLKKTIIQQEETDFSYSRLTAEKQKSLFQYSYEPELKKSFKSLLKEAENQIENFNGRVYSISSQSYRIIRATDSEVIRYARYINYSHLYSLIKDNVNIRIIFTPADNINSPFSMPILFKDRYSVQKKLADNGLFAPILWTIKDKAKAVCKVSKYISENMLSIPIDQRLDYWDIERIGEIINKCN